MRRKVLTISGLGLLFLLALGITFYPLFSSWYAERHQGQVYTQYKTQLAQAEDRALVTAKRQAEAYNKTLIPGQTAEAFSQEALLAASEGYAQQLDLTGSGIMGYVEIPCIGVNLPIYHGTDAATLEAGVGHLLGTSLPVGGKSTHCALTGHSGMARQKLFSDLDALAVGDLFYLNVLGKRLVYQVDQIKTVLPEDTTYLGIVPGEDHCTLVTCTPFGVNTHRLLVRGTRISEEAVETTPLPQKEQGPSPSTWTRQYLLGIAAGLAAAAAGTALAVFLWKKKKTA